MQNAGIGAGSPNTEWDAYPALSPELRGALNGLITPRAYKAAHYHPDTFARLFGIRDLAFRDLLIFRISDDAVSSAPAPTELPGFTVVRSGEAPVEEARLLADRSALRGVFEGTRRAMEYNRAVLERNRRSGNTEEVDALLGLGFAFALQRSDTAPFLFLKGFYPYFTDGDATGRCFFVFFHAAHARLALLSAPTAQREHALGFILAHGELHTFARVCAACGKIGVLRKCKCEAARYCDRECQALHWAAHKADCRAAVARRGGAALM